MRVVIEGEKFTVRVRGEATIEVDGQQIDRTPASVWHTQAEANTRWNDYCEANGIEKGPPPDWFEQRVYAGRDSAVHLFGPDYSLVNSWHEYCQRYGISQVSVPPAWFIKEYDAGKR